MHSIVSPNRAWVQNEITMPGVSRINFNATKPSGEICLLFFVCGLGDELKKGVDKKG